MADLWSLGGLSLWELLRRTARESWEDAVFGQGGRMAFYQFLAIFPTLLVALAVVARAPQFAATFRTALEQIFEQVLPSQGARLFDTMMGELSRNASASFHFAPACLGALWAAANATWAMIWGLNRAYEVKERRSKRQLALTIAGLMVTLGLTGCIALFLIFGGAEMGARFHGSAIAGLVRWLAVILALSFGFGMLYRYAPNVRDPEWRWSTPGAVCALILWVGSTVAARFYFERVNDYSRSYGHLNGVVMLLLWLYVTNGAILIGGEMNSEIEKALRPGDGADRSGS